MDDPKRAENDLRLAISERARLTAVRADIGIALARKDSLRGILNACAEALVRHLDAAFARIWTFNGQANQLELQASAGKYTHLDGRHSRIPFGERKIGLIAQERRPHLTNDVQNDPRIGDKDWARAENMTAFAGYPLVVEDRIVGVMGMFSQKALTESTLETLALVADGIGQGIERKRAEDALRTSEQNLRLTVDSIAGLVMTFSASGELEDANRPFLDYTGCTLDEVRRGSNIFHPDDYERVMSEWRTSVQTGGPFYAEARLRRSDGVFHWFVNTALPLRDKEGRIIRWHSLLTDIDDRKQVESALLYSEERYRVVVEAASDAIVSIDDQGLIVFSNAATKRIFGHDSSELIGKPLTLLMPVYMRELHTKGLKRYLGTGQRHINWQGTELTALRKNGEEFPAEVSFGELIKDDHKIFTGFIRDISKRKEAEQALQRSEALLAQGQHLSRMGSYSWRAATDEITWSDELFRIYELDPPLTPARIRARVHPEDLTLYEKMVEQARSGGNFESQYRLVMPDHSIKYLHAVAHATRDENGQLEYIAAVQDVTARRLSEEALDKARSELARVSRLATMGELAASIAHEVNQPLTAVTNNANACLRLLANRSLDAAVLRQVLEEIVADSGRASAVISRIRGFIMKAPAERKSLDINEVVQEVSVLAGHELQKRGVAIEFQLAETLPLVRADRVQLQQVLLNLTMNAIEAMTSITDRPRVIWMRSEVDESGNVLVAVRDSGPGLGAEAVNLFTPFFTTKANGLGMGLSISRSLVENHGGRLWAAPNSPQGAVFSFTLPTAGVS
jgi:PAS domain S-box-containing protein